MSPQAALGISECYLAEHVKETRKTFRHLATTLDGNLIAFGEFKRAVHIFDLTTGNRVSEIDTDLDFGGRRLAIDPNGEFCAVASYDKNSVSLYNVHGRHLWRRTDVDEVQSVRFALDGKSLFCSHHFGTVSQFDVSTGEKIRFTWTKKELYGVKNVYESSYDECLVIDQIENDIRITNFQLKHVATVKRKAFAILDCAFAPEFMCISESGGPVTCYHLESGRQVWELPFGSGVHALHLSYNEESKHFSAIAWHYKNGGPHILLSITRHNGEIVTKTQLPDASKFGFISCGKRLLLTTGDIMSATTGDQIGVLAVSTDSAK